MKKIICLLLAAVAIFTFTACNDTPSHTNEETQTTAPEVPVPGENDTYTFDEYSDHIVLTSLKKNVTSVTLPEKINDKPVTAFGTVFSSSLTLSNFTIPANSKVTAIEKGAFSECPNLKNFIISSSCTTLTSIESEAFFGCQNLHLARIPATVTDIAEDAFKYCTELVIYGQSGSAIDEFCQGFSSIYFRDANTETTASTTVPEEAVSTEESTTEEVSTEENTTVSETTTRKKVSTTKKQTTVAPTTEQVTEATTRGLLNIFDLP